MENTEDLKKKLAPTGVIRAAINLGNPVLAQQDNNGELDGVSVRLAQKLADLLNLDLEMVVYNAAGKVVEACKGDKWDIAFLAIDPKRSETIKFTMPYVIIEGTYLVKNQSDLYKVSDLDQVGSSIAVGKGAAYDLFLSRHLEKAEIVRAPTSAGAVDAFVKHNLTAAAGVRQPLEKFARKNSGYRVLEDSFTKIEQAMAIPADREGLINHLRNFVRGRLDDGFVRLSVKSTGQEESIVPD